MTSKHFGTGRQACLIGIAILLLAGFCFGQPAVSLSPKEGPPTTTLQVSGSGFTPYAAIDIYFDSQDEALAVADGSGAFSRIAIQAPKSAVPGNHWVSAAERSGRNAKQEIFEVHVNWTEFHTIDMMRWNPYENILNVNNVGSLQELGSYKTGSTVSSSPAVVDHTVYVGSYDDNVYALSARTGRKLWSFTTGGWVDTSPAVANGVVYVGSYDGNVYALNASTGALLWSYGNGGACSPTVSNGVVYVCGYGIEALNANTGALLWGFENNWEVSSSPAVANGVVYIGECTGNVVALDAGTGALLWSFALGGYVYIYSAPAVANGVVYVGANDNNLYALNASTGALLWSYTTGGAVQSSPSVVDGVVYVGSNDGNVYAFGLPPGMAPQPPKRPDPKTLRPDFSLKVSQPVASTASAN